MLGSAAWFPSWRDLVPVNGLEPLPIRLQGDRSIIRAKLAYLAGQEGFEPSTNRLTADRTTSVLLTLNAKSPAFLRGS